ncbi:hypothetical protein WMY93_006428 [Mugilogobius chulae]|uniref:GPCR family 2 latrophilin C-terminal domain-containing protein n=1 Tax=Mugilogobius chulae TaxID=88201 RepID=A0AAW0PZL6_9GOBI
MEGACLAAVAAAAVASVAVWSVLKKIPGPWYWTTSCLPTRGEPGSGNHPRGVQCPSAPPSPPPPDSHPPPPPPPHSFSRPRRMPQETSESFFPLLTNEHTDEHTHSPNHRDSLYTSMPVLTDLPDAHMNGLTDGEDESSGELQPCKSATAPELDDVYYKSMPNLGSRNHLHELQSYYHMGRGGSDGYMVSENKDESDSSPEEPL